MGVGTIRPSLSTPLGKAAGGTRKVRNRDPSSEQGMETHFSLTLFLDEAQVRLN